MGNKIGNDPKEFKSRSHSFEKESRCYQISTSSANETYIWGSIIFFSILFPEVEM